MARTQAEDYEERRAAIVDAAAKLFAARGFNGASVAGLAQACRTSKSLIYHYYSSKEEILHAVMASHIDQLVEDVEDLVKGARPASARLDALIHRFMEHYVGAAERQKVLLNELDNLPPDKRAVIVAKQRALIAAVQMLLTEIDASLAGDPQRARVETMLLFGMINWTHTWFDPKGPVSAGDVAAMALDLVLRRDRQAS